MALNLAPPEAARVATVQHVELVPTAGPGWPTNGEIGGWCKGTNLFDRGYVTSIDGIDIHLGQS